MIIADNIERVKDKSLAVTAPDFNQKRAPTRKSRMLRCAFTPYTPHSPALCDPVQEITPPHQSFPPQPRIRPRRRAPAADPDTDAFGSLLFHFGRVRFVPWIVTVVPLRLALPVAACHEEPDAPVQNGCPTACTAARLHARDESALSTINRHAQEPRIDRDAPRALPDLQYGLPRWGPA